MDPTTTFCPNLACPARGQTGQGNIGIHSCKDKRFHLHGVPQDVQRHERHGILSPADLCGDGQPGGDADGPRVSTPSDRRGVWL